MLIIRLSRRNLLALLAKLEDPTSTRTIVKYHGYVSHNCNAVICAEPDDEHYRDRGCPPGPMDKKTEQMILLWEEFLETQKKEGA